MCKPVWKSACVAVYSAIMGWPSRVCSRWEACWWDGRRMPVRRRQPCFGKVFLDQWPRLCLFRRCVASAKEKIVKKKNEEQVRQKESRSKPLIHDGQDNNDGNDKK